MIFKKIDSQSRTRTSALTKSTARLTVITVLAASALCATAQQKPASHQPTDDYASAWKPIDSLINKKGLPQSALTEIDKLCNRAKKEHNDPQLIKTLLYRMNLQESREEDATVKNAAALEKEIDSAREPARSILLSILAETYWNYFQANRYKLYNRSATGDNTTVDNTSRINIDNTSRINIGDANDRNKKTDMQTWDRDQFHKRIGELYLASLKNERILEQTDLSAFDAILIKGNSRRLRPTLYDLLGNRALEYFKTDETDINKPAYVFELDDPLAFSDATSFAGYPFANADTLSFKLQALKLYQRLIRFHLPDARPDALLDVNIDRLRFVCANAVMEDKDSLYMAALTRITDRYGNEKQALTAWSIKAEQYADRAAAYASSKDPADQYGYVKAKAICDQVLANSAEKDSSEGRNNCQELLKRILQKELSMNMEKVNLPGQPMRNLVSWRNIPQIYFRLLRVDHTLQESLGTNSYSDEYWQKLLQLPVLKLLSQALPETGDYQQHRTEIRIDALPVGDYALVVSSSKDFSLAGPILAVQYFSVSGIAYVNTDRDYFVVNRESGQPLAGASVQIWNRTYEYKTNKFILSKAGTYTADEHGHFLMKKKALSDGSIQQWLEISTTGDHLFPDGQSTAYYLRYRGNEEEDPSDKPAYERKYRRTFFFTDRAIYRPGQTLYFKGIVVTRDKDSRQSKVLSSFQTRVRLLNANGQPVDSLDMVTNEFGSYHGKFTLPGNGLNGEFSIADDSADGRQSFSVEEYKRPKFYLDYDKLKGSYRVGDTIKVIGNAKAYAGNLIDGAKVKYRVVRQARFPYTWLYRRWGRPAVSEQEIAHGETTTAPDGKFIVSFAAIPDRKVSKDLDPVFGYNISADVTDINGETRSAQTTVSAGYKAIQLAINLPEGGQHMPADSLKQLIVRTTNLSGEPEPAAIHMTIYSLQCPDRMIRKRYWEMPDQFVIDKKDYLEAFPHDEYKDETQVGTWQHTGKVAERLDSSGVVPIFRGEFPTGMRTGGKVNDQRLLPGWYAIEVTTTDKYGAEIRDIKYVELYEGKTGQPLYPQYNWGVEDNTMAEPGSNASVDIGSSAGNVFVIRKRVDKIAGKPMHPSIGGGADDEDAAGAFNFLPLNKERKTTTLPVTGNDRGGFGVLDVFVKDNRVYTNVHTILVPWSNKELKINYTSFRDKTRPGGEERWSVNISGYKGDRVTAEVLASMYDASLDQFKMQYWNKPDLYPRYYPESGWMSNDNFSMVNSWQKYFAGPDNVTYVKQYDQIMTEPVPVMMNHLLSGRVSRPGAPEAMNAVMYKTSVPAPSMALAGRAAGVTIRGAASMDAGNQPLYIIDGVVQTAVEAKSLDPGEIEAVRVLKDAAASSLYGAAGANGVVMITTKKGGQATKQEVQVRKNFNETAFFFPDLQTDAAGDVSFSFTMPEALTNWRLLTLAHTRDLAFGFSEKTTVTQKQLMVQPNAPRFLREGDRIELSARIVNLSDSELTGQVELQLTDATTNQSVDGWLSNRQANQYFTVAAGQSTAVRFPMEIPYQFNRPVTYRIVAHAKSSCEGEFGDGEEDMLPVVSNRVLVTESLPLTIRGNGTRDFRFEGLLRSGSSETLNHHALTVEFSSNPAWYAVQALPYLTEYPYECAEQTFERYFANALAASIVKNAPRIREIFPTWKTVDTSALLSNLEKNPELKSVLLEETPWVLEAKTESQQKKNIALLFDMTRMTRELGAALNKLQDMQAPNGGFVWFKGGPDDRYITQTILSGIGHLKKLKALPSEDAQKIDRIVKAGLDYLDKKMIADYESAKKLAGGAISAAHPSANRPGTTHPGGQAAASPGKSPTARRGIRPIEPDLGSLRIQYLYLRSLFSDYDLPGTVFPAMNFYRNLARQHWLEQNRYMQGMIALALFRTGDIQTAKDILKSLKQNALTNEETGMYWKNMAGGYYWYQAPIETQSLLIEAFREITRDTAIDQGLKTWLLRQKQTQNWSTTKATADACYALLLGGSDWLAANPKVTIRLGNETIVSDPGSPSPPTSLESENTSNSSVNPSNPAAPIPTPEAGTGYFKRVIPGNTVKPEMGNISVTLSSSTPRSANIAWGAVYWQYFENADKVSASGSSTPETGTSGTGTPETGTSGRSTRGTGTSGETPGEPKPEETASTPLKLTKKLFITRNTDRGPALEPLEENAELHIGDKITVRVELHADREMEYVHMKDMRASCMEPVNVLSAYKWQDGLGYYETTKDASTNFFFDRIPRGVYVFEYPMFVSQAGNFSNGITTIQCMYAPEFGAHSEGIRVSVASEP